MNRSFTLFVVSLVIVLLVFLTAAFWDLLDLGESKMVLAIALTIAFGISISGMVFGFTEIRKNKAWRIMVGLIGNGLILLIFIYTIYLAAQITS